MSKHECANGEPESEFQSFWGRSEWLHDAVEVCFGLILSDPLGSLGESSSSEITRISYDASSDSGDFPVTLTLDSKSGKTYTAHVTLDLTISFFDRTDIYDGIVGEEGSSTVVIAFDASALDKEVTKVFVVMVEN